MLPTILIGVAVAAVIALGLARLLSALRTVSSEIDESAESALDDESEKEAGTWLARD